jgi:hypothetical protein
MPISPEHLLTSSDERLHRQVHPKFISEGRLSSQAFRPNSSDDGQLSTSRSSLVSARIAYERYVARLRQSIGVWSVTVVECRRVELRTYADPLDDDDAHSLIDFTTLPSKSQWSRAAELLTAFARGRGCQHAPSGQE